MSEPTRARYPDETGFVERDGVRTFYEVYGEGDTTILLLPAWCVVYSRLWKGQIPYFARHHRVVAFDGRGNGRSSRPTDPAAYCDDEIVADTIAVLDATGTDRAVVVGVSAGGWWGPLLAGLHPDRFEGAVLICPASALGDPNPDRVAAAASFDQPGSGDDGWVGKWNREYWLSDFEGFVDFFAHRIHTERHSTRQLEDMTSWMLGTSGEVLAATVDSPGWTGLEAEGARRLPDDPDRGRILELYDRVACPTLVIHGDSDAVIPLTKGEAVAEAIGARLVVLEGSGHAPEARIPVKVNLLIREFVESLPARAEPRAAAAA